MSNIAFIPARGGSRSIPLKNIKEINGKPLIYWVLKASNEAKFIDEIFVATDSEKIKSIVLSFNFSKVKVYDRDPENAKDTSPTMDVVNEFLKKYEIDDEDNFILIQATSPLLRTIQLEEMYEKYNKEKADSALTCVRIKKFFWNEDGHPINYDYNHRPRRQDFKGCLMENGACYISTIKNLKKANNLLNGKISVYEMPEYTGFEIDEPDDFLIIENLMKKYSY